MRGTQKTLPECAEIIPGVLEQKKAEDGACTYKAVMPCQITASGFVREYGQIQRLPGKAMPFLQVGDVLIKRLNPDWAVVFDDDTVNALPSANLFVIRPNPDTLDSYFLAFILESSKALDRISQRSGIGTAVSAVTTNQIRQCVIPVPAMEDQRKLGALWRSAKKRNELLRQLIAENDRLLFALSKKMYQ